MNDDLMIEERVGIQNQPNFKPFARPYFVKMRGFMEPRTANYSPRAFPATTFSPGQVEEACKFPINLGTPKHNTFYGIGSLSGNVSKSNMVKFCTDNNIVQPDFSIKALPGANTVSDPSGANVENDLDLQRILVVWNRAFPGVPCKILMIVGPNIDNGIADVTTALAAAGCDIVSWSWGAAKSQWTAAALSYTENAFAAVVAKGVVIVPASGDNSQNDGTKNKVLDYPAASVHCWAVGGTSLTINANGEYVSEKAWGDGLPGDEGGGGGFDPTTPMPDYQKGIAPGSFRCGPDWSFNADPQTGYRTWSDGKVMVIGGTSASAPMTAGLFGAILGAGGSLKNYQSVIYQNRKTCCMDVILGSNGSPATTGYDMATGLGSGIGTAVAAALGVGAPVIIPPSPPPVGVTITITNSGPLPAGTHKVTV